MKHLILIVFILMSSHTFACLNPIDVTNAQVIIATGLGPEISCKSSECVCADKINWNYAKVIEVTTYQDDRNKPIYTKSGEVSCLDQQDCDNKFVNLTCENETDKVKNYDLLQVYCAKFAGYEQVAIVKKDLVEDSVKKAAYKAAQDAADGLTKQEVIDLKAAIAEIQDPLDIDAATNLNQLKAATKDKVKKIGKVLKFFMRNSKG